MKTLFLHPRSFDGFDGGAGSRYQAKREIKFFWYPTWLAQPAALIPGSRLIDAPRTWIVGPFIQLLAGTVLLFIGAAVANADSYSQTIATFKDAGRSGSLFSKSYGFAVFPTVGGAGFVVGAAHGRGRVYVHNVVVGDTTMNLVSAGFQAGAKAYSEIIFFEDKRALDEFESGNFEFGADASAVAITAGVQAGAGTNGVSSEAGADSSDAHTSGGFYHGMSVFTIAKGGLMYAATISGQKFSFSSRNSN